MNLVVNIKGKGREGLKERGEGLQNFLIIPLTWGELIREVQFFKQGPAYKKEGPDPNKGSNQQ